jgi:hypothetical protein
VRRLLTQTWRFVHSEAALSTTEYAVMLALIVCLCMGPVQSLGCSAQQAFTKASNSLAR